jgi:hypothetical protein
MELLDSIGYAANQNPWLAITIAVLLLVLLMNWPDDFCG